VYPFTWNRWNNFIWLSSTMLSLLVSLVFLLKIVNQIFFFAMHYNESKVRVGHLYDIKENRSTHEVIIPTPLFICCLSSSPLRSFLFPQQSESHRCRDRLHVECSHLHLQIVLYIGQGKFGSHLTYATYKNSSWFGKRSDRNHRTLCVYQIALKLLYNIKFSERKYALSVSLDLRIQI